MSDIFFAGDVADRKLKRKLEEPPAMDKDSEVLLSLSLGGNNNNNKMAGGESSSKLTFKSLKSCADSSGIPPKPLGNPKQQRLFPCKFCDKMFPSSQALGGHQNAHRRERVLSRMDKVFNTGTFGLGAYHLCPYSNMANHFPFRGSSSVPLYQGAHMHPMVHHMPSTMPCPRFGPGYGNQQGLHNIPQSFHRRDAGFGCELAQFPSPSREDQAARGPLVRANLGGLLGNNYTGNQPFSSPRA